MNKIELCFLKSHIKRAIYELEVANKMQPNTVDVALIIELKLLLENIENSQ